MKVIKFRYVCWNKHFKEISLEYLTDDLLREHDHVPSWIFSDNCEIKDKQLSTGLKDKNGKEVYEGDIFNSPSGNKFKVVFEKGCFLEQHIFDEHPSIPISRNALDWEVIGNVYENPEISQEKAPQVNKGDE